MNFFRNRCFDRIFAESSGEKFVMFTFASDISKQVFPECVACLVAGLIAVHPGMFRDEHNRFCSRLWDSLDFLRICCDLLRLIFCVCVCVCSS